MYTFCSFLPKLASNSTKFNLIVCFLTIYIYSMNRIYEFFVKKNEIRQPGFFLS